MRFEITLTLAVVCAALSALMALLGYEYSFGSGFGLTPVIAFPAMIALWFVPVWFAYSNRTPSVEQELLENYLNDLRYWAGTGSVNYFTNGTPYFETSEELMDYIKLLETAVEGK
tara:strand:- start:103 stop:447 length:345 start_codon:yes stop_codon:yes gene_type:complete